MGLEKVGINIGKEFVIWTRTNMESLFASNSVKINTKGIKYVPKLKTDTFVKKIETWADPADHICPYIKEGKTMVKGHHSFHSANDFCNQSFEQLLKEIESFKDTDYQFYQNCIDFYNKMTKNLLKRNENFTKLVPQPRNCKAYRGTLRYKGQPRQDFDTINNANIGDVIIPTRGFAYSAHHKLGAYQYMGSPYDDLGNIKFEPMLIEYKIPKGAQVSSNFEHGGEVVFPALSEFKLLSKETRYIEQLNSNGKAIGNYPYKHVILEYIPQIPLLKDFEKFYKTVL